MVADRKLFLRRIYAEWQSMLAAAIPEGPGRTLELGAGAQWMPPLAADSIRSDVRVLPGLHLAADALRLPFPAASLKFIGMTDVFHHIPDSARFLNEAARVLRPGGRMAMIEPWHTAWSRFIYTRFHHEPFNPAGDWTFSQADPMLDSNQALPWIVFKRDHERFKQDHPDLFLERIEPFMPIRYLLSGGLTFPSLQPGFMFPFWTAVEPRFGAMFAFISVLRR